MRGSYPPSTINRNVSPRGGNWWLGIEPGTGEAKHRCYIGQGTLPDLNPDCGDSESCDDRAEKFGQCADCHAPGIDGKLGGRDLLEATGVAHESGVHCDICHKVESIDMEAEPGVAGRLKILRPSDMGIPAFGTWAPLTFGPDPDVINPRMGSVERSFFREAEFCAGCHQQDQEVLLPAETIDTGRWPDGRLPVHSTYEEWREGPLAESTPCASCHMPPSSELNGSDLHNPELATAGTGWARPAGQVREHSWVGPRTPESKMLELAAAVFIDKEVVDGELRANLRVKNVGPGHALPTGEPMRSMVLYVEARCGDERLVATGGDAVPDFGGYKERKESPADWTRWDEAKVGDVVRVIGYGEGWHDYNGHGPFGDDGSFSPEEKGMRVENVLGMATIVSIDEGVATFDRPLPSGDVAYLGTPDRLADGVDPDGIFAVAGAPGFAFARVMVGPEGEKMVPHYRAVDVASDNRLLPQKSWTSEHTFEASCESPTVRAILVHRAYPISLIEERGWDVKETVMVDTWK